LLEAVAGDALGRTDDARHALERALDAAASDHLLFPFLLHPAPGLLARHAGGATAHGALIREILGRLGTGAIAGAGPGPGPGPGASTAAGIEAGEGAGTGIAGAGTDPVASSARPAVPAHMREPLSGSEMRVLRYLPTNLSAPEIAVELSLSVNTVRTHMRHVYEKLGAHRRFEAVELARALGLVAAAARP
jgi:LuxR family maltose regulon positive regulatory protein